MCKRTCRLALKVVRPVIGGLGRDSGPADRRTGGPADQRTGGLSLSLTAWPEPDGLSLTAWPEPDGLSLTARPDGTACIPSPCRGARGCRQGALAGNCLGKGPGCAANWGE